MLSFLLYISEISYIWRHCECQLTKVSKFAGHYFSWGRGINRFCTSVAIEEPITPPVQIDHTQLLINGQFVDAVSGSPHSMIFPRTQNFQFFGLYVMAYHTKKL